MSSHAPASGPTNCTAEHIISNLRVGADTIDVVIEGQGHRQSYQGQVHFWIRMVNYLCYVDCLFCIIVSRLVIISSDNEPDDIVVLVWQPFHGIWENIGCWHLSNTLNDCILKLLFIDNCNNWDIVCIIWGKTLKLVPEPILFCIQKMSRIFYLSIYWHNYHIIYWFQCACPSEYTQGYCHLRVDMQVLFE